MARQFNGTSDSLQSDVTVDLTATSALGISFWLWWDAFANDDKFAMELSAIATSNVGAFYIDPNSSAAGNPITGLIAGNVGGANSGDIARPSAAAWHHYVFNFDFGKSTQEIDTIYVDSVSQSITRTNDNNNTNTWGNFTLNCMSRNNTSLFGAGRLAEVALYRVLLTQTDVNNLYNNGNGALATSVQSGSLSNYWRILGTASPEPPTVGSVNLTVNGTVQAAHPFTISGIAARRLLRGVGV